MAATTTQIIATRDWVKLSDGDCTIQANHIADFYDIAVSEAEPTTQAAIKLKLFEPVTFAYKTAVWCKLSSNSKKDSTVINVIK